MPSAAAPIETLLFRKDYETAAPAHSHNYLELVFPLDAPLQVHLEDLDMFRVHPGEVLLVPAFLSHSLQADRLHQRWLVLRLHLHKHSHNKQCQNLLHKLHCRNRHQPLNQRHKLNQKCLKA